METINFLAIQVAPHPEPFSDEELDASEALIEKMLHHIFSTKMGFVHYAKQACGRRMITTGEGLEWHYMSLAEMKESSDQWDARISSSQTPRW